MREQMCLSVPFEAATPGDLVAGQRLLLTGVIYGARDAAHQRFIETLARGEDLPVDLRGQVIYYVGPTPVPPGRVCGAAGPTTAGRMDLATPEMLAYGVRALIGKGKRSPEVIASLKEHGAVYLAATGGLGALIGRCIKEMQVAAYPDLGPEALYRLVVEDFPVTVAVDSQGRDYYMIGPQSYRKTARPWP